MRHHSHVARHPKHRDSEERPTPTAKILVHSRVEVSGRGWPKRLVKELEEEFTHENPKYLELVRQGRFPPKSEPRQYKTFVHTVDPFECGDGSFATHMTFPRGGFGRIRNLLNVHNVQRDGWIDGMSYGDEQAGELVPDHRFPDPSQFLRDYQKDMIRVARESMTCLIQAGTGTGKTTAGLALIAQLKRPALITLWSAALVRQWLERIEKELGLSGKDVGLIQGPTRRIRPVTVAMQATLHLHPLTEEENNFFGIVISDETQRAPAATYAGTYDSLRAAYRIGMTADHERKDKKDFLTRDLFGKVAIQVDREDMVAAGNIVDVEIRVIRTRFKSNLWGDYPKLIDELVKDKDRNLLILDILRMESQDAKVIVFTQRRDHAMQLDRMLSQNGFPCGLLLGGKPDEVVFKRTIADLKSGAIRVAVGTVEATGTGLDIPDLSIGIAATPLASNKQLFGQVRGRLCRIADGKDRARLYYLFDHLYFRGTKHLKNIVEWNPSVSVRTREAWVPGAEYLKKPVP